MFPWDLFNELSQWAALLVIVVKLGNRIDTLIRVMSRFCDVMEKSS